MRMTLTTIAVALLFAPLNAYGFDAENGARIKTLVDTGMQYYWTGGDVKKAEAEIFKGITLHGRYDVTEQAFKEAASLAPERIDFSFGVASSQILQKKISEARQTYQTILAREPRSFDAQVWLAALARVEGDETGTALADLGMASLDRDRAEAYRARFARAEEIMSEKPNIEAKEYPGQVTIVILGYALAKDGTAQKPLLDRMDVALKVAQANPNAKIIAAGGQPQNGVTEGDVMTRWFVEKGIDRDRIIIEDKSKDTVGNALNTANLLRRHKAERVILVSSASHMRRARAVFEDAFMQTGIKMSVIPLAALDFANLDEAAKLTKDERLVVYRDLVRVSGIWAYPGLQQ